MRPGGCRASVCVGAETPVVARLCLPSESRGAAVLLSIGDVGRLVSVHIGSRRQLVEIAAVLTLAHREWAALVPDDVPGDDVTAGEMEVAGLPPW